MQLLTASRLKAWRTCQRLHFYRFLLGRVPRVDPDALRVGTVLHLALEAWWNAHRQGAQEQPLEAALATLPDGLDPFERARLTALLVGYDVRHGEWASRCEVLGVEVPFQLPLVNPATRAPSRTWLLAGKIDGLLRLPDGRVACIEHKSTSERAEPGSTYRSRLLLDGQVSQYFEGCEALGQPLDLVLYDVLVKPALRPLAATPVESRRYTKAGALYASQRAEGETPEQYLERLVGAIGGAPEEFFHHVDVVRLEGERAEYRRDVWQYGWMMRKAELAGFAPINSDACHSHGPECSYWDVCSGKASLDDPTLYRQLDNVHPELAPAPTREAA